MTKCINEQTWKRPLCLTDKLLQGLLAWRVLRWVFPCLTWSPVRWSPRQNATLSPSTPTPSWSGPGFHQLWSQTQIVFQCLDEKYIMGLVDMLNNRLSMGKTLIISSIHSSNSSCIVNKKKSQKNKWWLTIPGFHSWPFQLWHWRDQETTATFSPCSVPHQQRSWTLETV